MRRNESGGFLRAHWPVLVLPLLALLPVLPLLLHGPSCGHDFGFHLQSWMDASAQMRHGDLLPRWAYSPAFNAGEPRFIFYPPLSWLIGSVLLLALPSALAPAIYTWLALTGAALAMYALARRYAPSGSALVAAAVYTASPYLLFTAYERTAYAELLAAAWMPLLVRAALAPQPAPLAIAVPLALLWLTNAPAAVMGTYALVLIALCRVLLDAANAGSGQRLLQRLHSQRSLLLSSGAGLGLGLALPAFYLVPAAWERRYVQIAMAIIPNMRVEDNFLFGHTGYGPHDQVLHTASMVAVLMAALTTLALIAAFLRQPAADHEAHEAAPSRAVLWPLLVVAVLTAGMLLHVTLPLWHVLPELAFLQFPWRLLTVMGCVLGAAVALALRGLRLPAFAAVLIALAILVTGHALAYPAFRQGCEAGELPADRLARFRTLHGVGPTDEYTPADADNDQLRWDDPAWWLTPNPNAPGPNTVPNPAATITDYDEPPPMEQTVSGRAPLHLRLSVTAPEDLVLNLRDYPAWRVTLNGSAVTKHLQRDDGLLAIALPAGASEVEVRWQALPDAAVGDGLSACALVVAGWLWQRSRKIGFKHER